MKTEDSSAGHWWLAPVVLLIVPFLPLLFAGVEGLIFHTGHVEGFCRHLGIHDELSDLYGAVFKLFDR